MGRGNLPGFVDGTPAALDLVIDVARIDPAVLRAVEFLQTAVDGQNTFAV